MDDNELKNKILNAYKVEKYAELSLLLLFLEDEKYDFRPIAAKLVLESDVHKEVMENILKKMRLEDKGNAEIKRTKEDIDRMDYRSLLKLLVSNEILAMNNYLELYLFTDKDIVKKYFEDPEDYYSSLKELAYEELNHTKRIIDFIYNIGDKIHQRSFQIVNQI
ncbi:MAG: hypothetical protein ACP5SF_00615 [Thermoplasmata archaeon]